MDSAAFEEEVRELPCDAKLVFVVLEKRGPFTQDEITRETQAARYTRLTVLGSGTRVQLLYLGCHIAA